MNSQDPSLATLAADTVAGGNFSFLLGDFLDAFYRAPQADALAATPPLLAGRVVRGDIWDAFLGAAAEALGRRFQLPIPAWCCAAERYLHHPFFPIESAHFRATLLLESPIEFRSRNLFVTSNALSRA
jgi:hypothetical protein